MFILVSPLEFNSSEIAVYNQNGAPAHNAGFPSSYPVDAPVFTALGALDRFSTGYCGSGHMIEPPDHQGLTPM
jgi:hypothetical protein